MSNALTLKRKLKVLGVVAILTLFLNFSVKAEYYPEYEKYVHYYVNSTGNWTFMEKPMFPVVFNESQILVGQNWSIVCPLEANHSYHVYCYGEWVNKSAEPKTDYDIYVYNPLGEMEGYHTEATGFPEHLGTTVDDALFVPKYSGNYTFVIVNDERESQGAQAATFMIIENVECNVWQSCYIEGKDDQNLPVFNTSWSFEFVTESQYIEVWVKVPETLDMFEARLYLMTNPQSKNATILNGVPLAWEPGLFGERDGIVGGYNLESKEYRGLAYASCEFPGQDMFFNFTLPYFGKNLYHLVFIGEVGFGTIEFLVKTEFGNACLVPSIVPAMVYPHNDTVLAYSSNFTRLENATLRYSSDGWKNVTAVAMEILEDNRTCRAVIPGQEAGTIISYGVEALDVLMNVLVANGSYSVKYPSVLNASLVRATVHLGENITVKGQITPYAEDALILVHFDSVNESKDILCFTQENGTFTASFTPESIGKWVVQVEFQGNTFIHESAAPLLTVNVEEPTFLMKYSLYIGGGIGAAAAIGIVIYWKKSKE